MLLKTHRCVVFPIHVFCLTTTVSSFHIVVIWKRDGEEEKIENEVRVSRVSKTGHAKTICIAARSEDGITIFQVAFVLSVDT